MMLNKCCSKFEHHKLLIPLALIVWGGVGMGISQGVAPPCGTPGGVCKPAQIEGPTIPTREYIGTCFCNCLPKPGRFTQCNLIVGIPKEGVFNCIGHCRYKNADPYPDMPGGPAFWRLHASSTCARGFGANGELVVYDLVHQVLDAGCWVVTKGQMVHKPAIVFIDGGVGLGGDEQKKGGGLLR